MAKKSFQSLRMAYVVQSFGLVIKIVDRASLVSCNEVPLTIHIKTSKTWCSSAASQAKVHQASSRYISAIGAHHILCFSFGTSYGLMVLLCELHIQQVQTVEYFQYTFKLSVELSINTLQSSGSLFILRAANKPLILQQKTKIGLYCVYKKHILYYRVLIGLDTFWLLSSDYSFKTC